MRDSSRPDRPGGGARGGGGGGGARTRAYLEVVLQPTELPLNQVAAIVEKEIYLSGERDDMGRTQVPATGVKRQGSEMGVCMTRPSGGQPDPPYYLYHKP